jgi:hypothetical protein
MTEESRSNATKDKIRIASFQTPSDFFETLQEMSRAWVACASAEVKLGFKLSENLIAARSIPDAVAAYGEWFSEEMGTRAESARQMLSHGQKFMDCSSRLLRNGWMSANVTT